MAGMNTHAPALIERADRMLGAFNNADAPAVAAFYIDDAVLIAPDGTRVEGRVAIADHLSKLLGSRDLRMAITPLASEIDGALGYVTGTYLLWSGDQQISSGSYAEVWKRTGDGWRIAVDAIVRRA
jgi:ketosteroid isomerase-like protein